PILPLLLTLFVAAAICVAAPARAGGEPSPQLIPVTSPVDGLKFSLDWDADIFDNTHGGIHRGYATDSLINAGVDLDTTALDWWKGGTFHLGLQAITSTHPSANYVGDLQT